MIERFEKPEAKALAAAEMRLLDQMASTDLGSDEYERLLTELERITQLKTNDRRPRVSRDTLVIAAANLLGILIIVAYEQNHVMTSKGLNFQFKKP